MAHYAKYKMNDIIGLLAHDNRTLKTERENIDSSRTYLNYNLHKHEEGEYRFFKNRAEYVKEQGGTIREDSVVLSSFVITLPENFPNNEELEKQFFEASYKFIKELFGEENIVSAWVHYDEAKKASDEQLNKPHIHIKALPILKTKKKYKNGTEKDRLSFNANKIITREYLQKFHEKLGDYLEDWLGFRPSIENGATKDGNKTIKELKAISEQQRKARTEIENDQKLQEAERKQILDQMWKRYQEQSSRYWNTYKSLKSEIKNNIWTLKKDMAGAEKELERNLDIYYNITRGLLYTIIQLLSALFIYCRKKTLEHNLKAVQAKYEALEEARRSISNYQHNTKEKLKKGDFEGIVQAMENWERAVINANAVIRDEMIEREICKPKEKEIDKVL